VGTFSAAKSVQSTTTFRFLALGTNKTIATAALNALYSVVCNGSLRLCHCSEVFQEEEVEDEST
jgi:hypothetical protein